MAHGTTYSAIKSLLVFRLTARPGLNGVAVHYQPPVDPLDVNALGSREAIWFAGADGLFSNVVFCGPALRFDESILVTLVLQVLGADTLDDQEHVDQRLQVLLYEVLSEIASEAWRVAVEQTDPTLSAFDYCLVTPETQEWNVGRLPQTGKAHGAGLELGIRVESRRSYP